MIAARAESLEAFRASARALLGGGVAPSDVVWSDGTQLGLGVAARGDEGSLSVPAPVAKLVEEVACHRDPERWDVLYRLLYRVTRGERDLLERAADRDVRRARLMQKAIYRDVEHVHAFVRFRLVDGVYVAWHRPEHRTLRLAAPFFRDRFPQMRWAILTPDESAHCDGAELRFGPGTPEPGGAVDALEDLWRTYYASVFNPARVNPTLLLQKLPAHHWRTLPEAKLIPLLMRDAGGRVSRMIEPERGAAAAFLPRGSSQQSLPSLAAAARTCTACDLCGPATQTVFGAGPASARIVLVGEQPGDEEDLRGAPFVGPSGSVLDDALDEAGIIRGDVYVTNAVKHFKFVQRGKVRLHQRASAREVAACRPWLEEELKALAPAAVVCLGATAGQSLLGSGFRLKLLRGKPQRTAIAPWLISTWHPAAVLRATTSEEAAAMRRELVDDLRAARQIAASGGELR